MKVMIDETLRTVDCSSCGAILDPVTVLIGYARHERKFQNVQGLLNDMIRKTDDLKKEERNIRARIKTTEQKGGSE